MDDDGRTVGAVTLRRLREAAEAIGPLTLHAASVDDEHGFADGLLLAEWAGALAPPALVCRRALWLLAAPRLWYASLGNRGARIIGMRWDGTATGNPAVRDRFPEPFDDPVSTGVSVEVPAADVVAALALQAEVLRPHDEDVLGAATDGGDGTRMLVRVGRAGGWSADRTRLNVLAWVLGLRRPTVERTTADAFEVSLDGGREDVGAALDVVAGWAAQRAARRALFAHLDDADRTPTPSVPGWDELVDELDALGIVVEHDDRQEDPPGDRGIVPRIDLGEPEAHRELTWEAPYDGQDPWLEGGLPGTQDRFLRTLLWARAEPERWTPRLVQGPVTRRPPWVHRLSW